MYLVKTSRICQCEEKLKILFSNPSEQAKEDFLQSVSAIPKELRGGKRYTKFINGAIHRLIYHYTKSENNIFRESCLELKYSDVPINIENEIVQTVKNFVKNPSGKTFNVFFMLLKMTGHPIFTLFEIFSRFFRKIFKIIGEKLHFSLVNLKYICTYRKYGYTRYTIKKWEQMKNDDFKKNPNAKHSDIAWAHKNGFLYCRLVQYGLTDDNVKEYISDKDYLLLNPINNSYKKWIEDIPSLRYCVPSMSKYMPNMYFNVLRRKWASFFVRMPDCPKGYRGGNSAEAIRLLRNKGRLLFCPAVYSPEIERYHLRYEKNKFYINGVEAQEKEIRNILVKRRRIYVLMDEISMCEDVRTSDSKKAAEFRAVIINEHIFNPKISELGIVKYNGVVVPVNSETGEFKKGKLPRWELVRQQILEFSAAIPQLEFYCIYFLIDEQGLKVMSINPHPAINNTCAASRETIDFLLKKLQKKREVKRRLFTLNKFRAFCWSLFKKWFCMPGYKDFMLHEYVTGVIDDFFHFKGMSIKDKLWCYKHGYYSFRSAQYQLTEENCDKFLSDRDYHWLCPINCPYEKWIDDKMTYRNIIEPFKEVCPKYYYHIMGRDGVSYAIRMEDCPEQYPSSFEGIVDLLQDVGSLAIKQSAGEHGDGFFKISYRDSKYYINHDEATRAEILERLKSLKRFYNVTQFLSMHESLKSIYPGSVNTVRVMVLNPTGQKPIIANAYLRIGTGATKMTDNIGYGGVFAKIDIDTGRYYGAEQLKKHVIVPCPVHPDTGVLIKGYLPDWELVKKKLVDICSYFGQLEYLGFDVALSSDGVKILEINKYQDLHRCAFYGDIIQDFFRDHIETKKKILRIK